MSYKKIPYEDIGKYTTKDNEAFVEIAGIFFSGHKDVVTPVIDRGETPNLYLVADLRERKGYKNSTYKVDFYECKEGCDGNKDWWLCLKRNSNKPFKYEDLPAKIQSSLENVFGEAVRNNFTRDKKSICLMTSANPREVAQEFKTLLMNLENG